MFCRITRHLCASVALLFLAGLCLAQEIVATPKHADGVYKSGETIQWHVAVQGDGAAAITQVHYVLKKGGLNPIREGTLDVGNGGGDLQISLDEPGTILGEISLKLPDKEGKKDKEVKQLVGAVVDPSKIQPSMPRPADFDAFWKEKIAELQAIPANPSVEAADCDKPNVEYYKVQLDNIRGTHVYGQLAKPKREGKFPAMLLVCLGGRLSAAEIQRRRSRRVGLAGPEHHGPRLALRSASRIL